MVRMTMFAVLLSACGGSTPAASTSAPKPEPVGSMPTVECTTTNEGDLVRIGGRGGYSLETWYWRCTDGEWTLFKAS
jgi:hypothetical protein